MTYDIKTKQVKQRFELCPVQINKIECTAKDTHILAALDNAEIRVYSNTTKQLSQKFVVPKSTSCTHLRCHHTKRHSIVAGTNHGIIALFDINVKKAMYVDSAHVAPVTGVAFSPIRFDVVVTSGRDRKLVYHDVISRVKIAEVSLENSVTALDFAPDGLFVIAGSQNGKITAFDTRNVQKPVHTFEAHNKEITNLLFQKQENGDGNSSVCMINEEFNVPETNLIEPSDGRVSYSFDYCTGMVEAPSPRRSPPQTAQDAGDSFMAAIGTFENDSRNLSVKSGTTTASSSGHPLNETKKIEPQSVSVLKKISSSTPKCTSEDLAPPELSPVVSGSQNQTCQPLIIQQTAGVTEDQVRMIIKEELRSAMNSFKREMQQEMYDVLTQMRRHFLDLQMSIVKEFVQVENHFTKLREDLETDDQCFGDELLQQQNYQLRKELQMLKEKMLRGGEKDE